MTAVTPDEMRRLAFIRYLYGIAVEQSQRPEPMKAASVLTFHDAVELFLNCSAEHLEVNATRFDFMDYWDRLTSGTPPIALTMRESMRRLNKLRVNLKHHGIPPTALDIEAARANVTSFFQESTPLVFDGLEFGDISMVQLVLSERVRKHLERAESQMRAGEADAALTEVAVAFAVLLDEYEGKVAARYRRAPFSVVPQVPFGNPLDDLAPDLPRNEMQRLWDAVYDVKASVRTIGQAMRVLTLGVDYKRYAKFQLLTQFANYLPLPGGNDGYFTEWPSPRMEAPSNDGYRFCFDFVIESALRLQEFDFDTK